MKITLTEEEYQNATEEYEGFCISCGESAYGVEPDARNYECESCGQAKVFGTEELLLMGMIELT